MCAHPKAFSSRRRGAKSLLLEEARSRALAVRDEARRKRGSNREQKEAISDALRPCETIGGSRTADGRVVNELRQSRMNNPSGFTAFTHLPLHRGGKNSAPKGLPCGWYAREARDLPQQRSMVRAIKRAIYLCNEA